MQCSLPLQETQSEASRLRRQGSVQIGSRDVPGNPSHSVNFASVGHATNVIADRIELLIRQTRPPHFEVLAMWDDVDVALGTHRTESHRNLLDDYHRADVVMGNPTRPLKVVHREFGSEALS